MATSRFALSLLILSGTTTAALVACSGDDDSGTTTTDSGTPVIDAASDATSAAQAVAAAVTVYYGAAVKLDATPSTGPSGFTYRWGVSSVPAGSALTPASLTDATTAMPGFQPDAVGVYTLTLTVAGGGTTSTIPVTVTVVDPPVFYARADSDGGPIVRASMNVVGAAFGNGGTPVSCFARDGGTAYTTELSTVGEQDSDWWEAPAGQPSKLVYAFETREDGASHTSLLVSSSDSTCATAPVKLDELGVGNPQTSRAIEEPKISPSGTRVAYLRTVPGGTTVSTIGLDGSGRRDLAPFYSYQDGGAAPDAATSGTVLVGRPTWVDDATIDWFQSTASGWQVVSISDVPGATAKIVMTCVGGAPAQLATLPSGEILVAGTTATSQGLYFLTAYTPDPTTKACSNARDLSKLATTGTSTAQDFSISPDKTKIAFVTTPDAGMSKQIRVINVDGSLVSSTPIAYGTGPRWVGGGAFLTWPATQATFDASVTSTGAVIAVSQVDGGGLHQITTATSGSSLVVPTRRRSHRTSSRTRATRGTRHRRPSAGRHRCRCSWKKRAYRRPSRRGSAWRAQSQERSQTQPWIGRARARSPSQRRHWSCC